MIDKERSEILFIAEIKEPEVEIDYEWEFKSKVNEIMIIGNKESQIMQQLQGKDMIEDTIIDLKDWLAGKMVKAFLSEQINEKE